MLYPVRFAHVNYLIIKTNCERKSDSVAKSSIFFLFSSCVSCKECVRLDHDIHTVYTYVGQFRCEVFSCRWNENKKKYERFSSSFFDFLLNFLIFSFLTFVCEHKKKYERTNEQYGYSVHIYVCDSFSQYNDDESESNERVSIKNLEEQPNESIFQ